MDRMRPIRYRRGFILTFDITIGLMIVIAMMAVTSHYSAKPKDNTFTNLQMNRVGGDVVRVMELNGTLNSFDRDVIESGLNSTLDNRFAMNIEINCADNGILELGEVVTRETFVGRGKRFFPIRSENGISDYCYLRYLIWER